MNEINNHLSNWVYSNKRLIIPGLGAFLKDEQTNNILFSSFLQYNDGLFEQVLAAYKSISIGAANSLINEFVAEVKETLQDTGKYAIKDLGHFIYDEQNTIQFIYTGGPNESNIIEPKPVVQEDEMVIEVPPSNTRKSRNVLLSSISLSLFILGLLLFFFLRTNNNGNNLLLEETVPIKTTQDVLTNTVDTLKKEIEVKNINAQNIANKMKYHIIGGCFAEKENAERFVQACRENGYKEAQIITKIGDLYPVSITKFDNMPEADKEKEVYNERFDEDAWVFRSF